jgi:hypothetical protein
MVDHTPLGAALWLARHHANFLLGVEGEDFSRWRSSLAVAEAERVLAIGGELVQRWLEGRHAAIGPLDPRQPGAWLAHTASHVASQLLTPFDVDFDCGRLFSDCRDPHFEEGTASRLLRGLVNCDGHSHIVALALAGWTRVELLEVPSHRLVGVPELVRDGRVYLDAFAELPPFTIARTTHDIAALDELAPIVVERDRRRVAHGRQPGDPLYLATDYEHAAATPLARPSARARLVEPATCVPHGPSTHDVIGTYLEARAHHLFGARGDAARLYRSIAGRGRGREGWVGTLRTAARLFAARLARAGEA